MQGQAAGFTYIREAKIGRGGHESAQMGLKIGLKTVRPIESSLITSWLLLVGPLYKADTDTLHHYQDCFQTCSRAEGGAARV